MLLILHSGKKNVHENSLKNLNPIQPGETRNPGGKPVGLRNSLNAKFLKQLSAEFDISGKEVIRRVAEEEPGVFLRVLAALQPKEMEIKRQLDDISDEQLDAAAVAIRAIINAQSHRVPTETPSLPQPVEVLPAVPEAT